VGSCGGDWRSCVSGCQMPSRPFNCSFASFRARSESSWALDSRARRPASRRRTRPDTNPLFRNTQHTVRATRKKNIRRLFLQCPVADLTR
jgi:hypothetical protein